MEFIGPNIIFAESFPFGYSLLGNKLDVTFPTSSILHYHKFIYISVYFLGYVFRKSKFQFSYPEPMF